MNKSYHGGMDYISARCHDLKKISMTGVMGVYESKHRSFRKKMTRSTLGFFYGKVD